MSKIKIRKKIQNIRKINSFELNYKNTFIRKIFKKHKIKKNSIIGGYYPVNYEFDCIQILKKLYHLRYLISLPIIKKKYQMEFYKWNFDDSLTVSSLGIPEPEKTKKVYPDILFVPIVAFDKYKNRIGYGGGYYDRYIEKILKKKKCLIIGLAFSNQKVDIIETNNYDKKMDIIITEKFIQE